MESSRATPTVEPGTATSDGSGASNEDTREHPGLQINAQSFGVDVVESQDMDSE